MKLLTRAEWKKLPPFQQGWALYTQASWPGSELVGESCPYGLGSRERRQFFEGEQAAVLAAQDSEE
jgi:hypothetical protein